MADRQPAPEDERQRDEPPAEAEPSTEDLEEPSTEKQPGEEPTAPAQEEPEPSHEAVGIGVISGPPSDEHDQAKRKE